MSVLFLEPRLPSLGQTSPSSAFTVCFSVQELGAPQTKSPSRSWKSRHFGCTFSSAVILSSPELYSKGCMEPCAAFCRRAAAPRETGSSLNSSQGGAAPGTCSLPPPLGWLPGPCQHPTCAAKGSWQPGAAPTCKTKGLVSNRLPCPQVCGLSQTHSFLSCFYFAKDRLSLQRPESRAFPAEHKAVPPVSWLLALLPAVSGFKRAQSSRIQKASPRHPDPAPAWCAPWLYPTPGDPCLH